MIKNTLYYSYLKIKYFFRIRKSRGFGIHSPFVFHLIRHIIKDKHPFYVFDLLTDRFDDYSYRDVKYAKIVYRVINELEIKHVFCKSPLFACDKLIFDNADTQFQSLESVSEIVDGYKVIYAGDDDFKKLIDVNTVDSFRSSKTLVVLSEMYKNDEALNVFKMLKSECSVSLDMFYRAFLFFDDKLQVGSYSIKV